MNLSALTPYEVARALADGIEEVLPPPEDPAPWSPGEALLALAASPAGIARAREVGLQIATNALRELAAEGAHPDVMPMWADHCDAARLECAALDDISELAAAHWCEVAFDAFRDAIDARRAGKLPRTATAQWFAANEARLAKAFGELFDPDPFEPSRHARKLLEREQFNAISADPTLDPDEFLALVDQRIARHAVDKRKVDDGNHRR